MLTRFVPILLALLAASMLEAQVADPDPAAAELRLLRATNERLTKENEALKAEVASLKRQLAAGEPTTRPTALSAGAGEAAPKKIVFIIDASGSMLNMIDQVREDVHKSIEELKPEQSFAVICDQQAPNPFRPLPKTRRGCWRFFPKSSPEARTISLPR